MAKVSPADMTKLLSGGAGNPDPDASLGGAISSTTIISQSAVADGPINGSGYTLVETMGAPLGSVGGELSWTQSTNTLKYIKQTGDAGGTLEVTADGTYAIPDTNSGSPSAYLVVSITYATLSSEGDFSTNIKSESADNELFDDIVLADFGGADNYRCFYLRNDHSTDTMFDTKIWINAQPSSGKDTLQLGLDPAGLNGTATTVANETTAPAGVTFSTPTSEGTSLVIGDLTPTDYYAVWVKRNVAAGPTTIPQDISSFRLRFVRE